jgi:starch synthase (maltosyl-transferring)
MQGQLRVYIDNVTPEIEGGKYSIAKTVGEIVEVQADIFCDGHDLLRAQILFRHEDEKKFHAAPMSMVYEDHWKGNFKVEKQ